jgi:DNA-binding CsgD family transcriptional regulator
MTPPATSSRSLSSVERPEPAPEDLIRLLISLSNPAVIEESADRKQNGPPSEEILLDIDVDGARFLLVRLPKANRPRIQLSPREQEIVRMVAQGHSNKVIADVLSISSWTVCTHLRRIFAKLGVGSRAAMVARLLETGADAGQRMRNAVSRLTDLVTTKSK